MGAAAGHVLYLFGVYRKIVRKNFEHVNIRTPNETRKIIPKLYRNMGRYTVDFLRKNTKSLPPHRLCNHDIYTAARAKDKGTIILLAHFGNWELLAAIWGPQVGCLNVVAKPMRNPLAEEWLHNKRTALSVKTIHTKNALRGMLGAIKSNEIIAVLIDQNLGKKMGTPAPFLGKTATTVRTVAGLAHKTGATVVPVYAMLENNGKYTINFTKTEPIDMADTDDDAVISAIQAQHNNIISQWIIEHPEHWFGWFHRRFKGYVDYRT